MKQKNTKITSFHSNAVAYFMRLDQLLLDFFNLVNLQLILMLMCESLRAHCTCLTEWLTGGHVQWHVAQLFDRRSTLTILWPTFSARLTARSIKMADDSLALFDLFVDVSDNWMRSVSKAKPIRRPRWEEVPRALSSRRASSLGWWKRWWIEQHGTILQQDVTWSGWGQG